MSLSTIEILRETIHKVQRRRNVFCVLWQTGWAVAGIISLFLVIGLLEMFFQFALADRITLLGLFLLGVIGVVWWYLRAIRELNRDRQQLAHYVEDHLPDLEQRLLTSIEFEKKEKGGVSPQLIERLWEDTWEHTQDQNIQQVAPTRAAWPAVGTAVVLFCFLTLALWNSVDFSRASQQILWPWPELNMRMLPVKLIVKPGDIRMQRGADVTLIATVENEVPEQVRLYLQNDRVNWDESLMIPEGSNQTYVQYFSSVTKDFTYYVDIGSDRSRKYQVTVFDMPRIEQIEVEYVYPKHTGMENKTEEIGGDIVAPEGTQIELSAIFNKSIDKATLAFGDGTVMELATAGNRVSSSFVVSKDSTYKIKVVDNEQLENENPNEYFIRSIPDAPPELKLLKPGNDRKVSSLEEATILATAQDDYGISHFVLNYSVAGGAEKQIPFLKESSQPLALTVEGEAIIYLEDLEVQPGDFVSYYLTAADNNGIQGPVEVFSDIYFLEVISTEREFRRATGQGGGGGRGGLGGGRGRSQQSSALAKNQKQIITATWKLLKRQKVLEDAKLKEDTEVVAEAQVKVLQRAQMSFRRLAERLSFSDESYDDAVKNMQQALEQMEIAAEKLHSEKLKEALAPEQEALKAILKAESQSRKTQLQMARNQGGQAGNSREQREREDLLELFSMEMGQLENRYELQSQTQSQAQTEEADPLAKLKELARRQERLNRAQTDLTRQQNQMTEAQKQRRLEELRREQEELQRRAEELAQQMSRLAQQGGQMSGRQQQLNQAAQQMQEASRSLLRQQTGKAATESRKALENLRNQEREMRHQETGSLSNLVDALSKKAQALTKQEKQIQQNLQKLKRQWEADISPEAQPSQGLQSGQETDVAQLGSEQEIQNEQKKNPSQSNTQSSQEMQNVMDGKETLQRDLRETEKMLRTVVVRGQQKQPGVANRALSALRSLRNEQIKERVEQSREMLKEGLLTPSLEVEEKIEQSLARLSKKLQDLGGTVPQSKEEQIQQAAASASNLRRELENLQKQVEALRRSNQAQQQALSQLQQGQPQNGQRRQPGQQLQGQPRQANQQGQQQGQSQNGQRRQPGQQLQGQPQQANQQGQQQGQSQQSQPGQQFGQNQGGQPRSAQAWGGDLRRARDNFQRARQYARGLLQPWARGERWARDARSIHRDLTQKEIEDFLNQPDLWKQLIDPVRDLESDLRARSEMNQLKKKLFSVSEEEIPTAYQNLVEEYYRALSQDSEGRVIQK